MNDTFSQWSYRHKLLGHNPNLSKLNGGSWCAICAEAKLITELTDVPFYPATLNYLRLKFRGFVKQDDKYAGDEIIWSRINRFLNIEVNPILWNDDRGHILLGRIKFPTIISVDGQTKTGYQSHFLYGRKGIYDKDKLVNIEIFDPYYDRNFLLYPHYDKGTLRDTIYSVINYRRLTNITKPSDINI